MAFFNHRKFVPDPDDLLKHLCEPFCDPTKNVNGKCPKSCFPLCNQTCYIPIIPQIPPLPQIPLLPPIPPLPQIPPLPPPRRQYSFVNDNNHPNRSHKLSNSLTISLYILCTFFSLFLLYTMYKYVYSFTRREQPQRQDQEEVHDEFLDEDHGPVVDHPIWYIRTIGLQSSAISAITICKYKRGDGLVEGTECSVCLSEFQEDETLRLLPKCNHAFHIPCIDTWLRSHTNCPMCRAGIVLNSAGPSNLISEAQIVDNSGRVEETQLGISANSSEFGMGMEDEAIELRFGIEEGEGELGAANVASIEENCNGEVDEVQPMRRSVSVDSLTASMISLAIANANLDSQLGKVNESNIVGIVPKSSHVNQSLIKSAGSSSIGKSLQKGPALMKRSFSFSGKVWLSRSDRSQKRVVSS